MSYFNPSFKVRESVPPEVLETAARLRQSGASKVCLVGGSVIDLIQGREPKDFDLYYSIRDKILEKLQKLEA